MSYQVSRDGQLYGPYTLEDLHRYVASGNILSTDLVKSEEMTDWIPVSQVLSQAAPAVAAAIQPQAYAETPAYNPAAGTAYPDPPNLHWGLVLLFGFLTCGFFFVIWDLIQVLWARRVEPQTKAFLYYILYVVLWVLNLGTSLGRFSLLARGEVPRTTMLAALLELATLVLVIVYRFTMKATLERHFNGPDPVGLRLGPIMTLFFGGLYFQYHFNRINEIKQAARYRGY